MAWVKSFCLLSDISHPDIAMGGSLPVFRENKKALQAKKTPEGLHPVFLTLFK